ncbi:hypothetical protein CB1_001107009 [Camelus ferus]|nr:hypothetical protein CB1_001107009 [Camelus ferus]
MIGISAVIFTDFKVVNVLAVCNMPFEIRLPEFTKNNRPHASYEPELHPAVCYRIKSLRATLQIFSTGSITVTGTGLPRKSASLVGTAAVVSEFKVQKCLTVSPVLIPTSALYVYLSSHTSLLLLIVESA